MIDELPQGLVTAVTANDSILWQRWQQRRDPDAFAEIVSRHSGMVYATCKRILGNAADAEDAAQDCFLELLNGRVTVRASLAPWLYTVAVRGALNRAKAERRRRQRERQFVPPRNQSTQFVLDDLVEVIDAAIAYLPEKLRTPVICRFLEGQSYEEMAQDSGVAESTTRYRTNKGIERIRAFLKRRGIPIGAAALSAMLVENMAEAAPPALVATLGKLSVAGTTASIVAETAGTGVAVAALKTVGGLLIMKKLAACALVVAALLAGVWATRQMASEDTRRETPTEVASLQAARPTPEDQVTESKAEEASEIPPQPGAAPAEATEAVASSADGIRVAGMVVDKDGEPVAGAHVVALIRGVSQEETVSSSDGLFEIYVDLISNKLILTAEKESYESNALGPMKLRDDGLDGLVLKLDIERRGRIAGTVVDRNGEPIPEVYVYPNRMSPGPIPDSVRADTHGEFELAGLPPANYAIVLSFNGGRGARNGESSMNVDLDEGQVITGLRLIFETGDLTIAGRVVDTAGNAIEGTNVLIPEGFGGDFSDEDGRFVIRGLEEGVVMVSAIHKDYSRAFLRNVSAGTEDIEVVMMGKADVEGRVFEEASGVPLTDFEVFHAIQATQLGALQNRQVVSNEEGEFTLDGLDAGEVTVTVRAEGFASSSRVLHLEEDRTISGLEFGLRSGARLEGTVVNAHGAPVAGAYIFTGSLPISLGGSAHAARSDSEGRFVIAGFSTETEQISGYHPDYAPAVVAVESSFQTRIVLQKPSIIEGVVLRGGEPVAGMMVIAISQDRRSPPTVAPTEKNGSYKLEGLAPGTVQVIANPQRLRDGRALVEMVAIDAGSVIQLDFDFKTTSAYVEGRVTVNGQPAGAAQVLLLSHSTAGARPQQTETTPDGYYRFEDVQAGYSTLRVDVTIEGGEQVVRQLHLAIEEEEAIQQDVDVSLSPNRQITGTVQWDWGEGMNHAVAVFDDTVVLPDVSETMAFMQHMNYALSIAECAEDGRFVIRGLELGHYTVVALEGPSRDQMTSIISEVTLTGEELATVDFDFRK